MSMTTASSAASKRRAFRIVHFLLGLHNDECSGFGKGGCSDELRRFPKLQILIIRFQLILQHIFAKVKNLWRYRVNIFGCIITYPWENQEKSTAIIGKAVEKLWKIIQVGFLAVCGYAR
jgi:hypothetical protein